MFGEELVNNLLSLILKVGQKSTNQIRILFSGNSKKAEIALGPNTDLSEGCGVSFNNEFFVFGGEFEKRQV